MRLAVPALLLSAVLAGCTHEAAFSRTFDADDFDTFEANVRSGTVAIVGQTASEKLIVRGSSLSYGLTQQGAERRQSDAFEVFTDDRAVLAFGHSGVDAGEVDFHVAAHESLDTVVEIEEGYVEMQGVHGDHRIKAPLATLIDVFGSTDVEIEHGELEAVLRPASGDAVNISSVCGPISLGLPRGLDYALNIDGDRWFGMDVEDLGFDTYEKKGKRITARRGAGTVEVNIDITGASLEIYGVDPL